MCKVPKKTIVHISITTISSTLEILRGKVKKNDTRKAIKYLIRFQFLELIKHTGIIFKISVASAGIS